MKPTTYNELAAKGITDVALSPVTIEDLREFMSSYAQHGHVIPIPGGSVARCFGLPNCKGCAMEQAIIEAMKVYGKD
jgi:hypothetical protein